jgi:hypothetical protein
MTDIRVENFTVTCLQCKDSSRIRIMNDTDVLYIDQTPIIACRFRPDLKMGFECICGNDSRLAPEEAKDIDMLVATTSKGVIDRILKTIKVKPERKFKMELA